MSAGGGRGPAAVADSAAAADLRLSNGDLTRLGA